MGTKNKEIPGRRADKREPRRRSRESMFLNDIFNLSPTKIRNRPQYRTRLTSAVCKETDRCWAGDTIVADVAVADWT